MNILLVGSGGREHALAWKIAQVAVDPVDVTGDQPLQEHARIRAAQAQDAAVGQLGNGVWGHGGPIDPGGRHIVHY